MTNVKKIAVLGTCFSRDFLNSDSYFNPNYKQYFNCIFTQFHSSIIAIISDPTTISLDKYNDIPFKKKKFVEMDFEKNFWRELKKEQPDYLIIDFYSDTLKSVGWLSSDCAITLSPIVEQSQLIHDLEFEFVLDHTNKEKYKEKFEESLQLFKKKITTYISEDQIILNKGRLTKSYYDEQREIQHFDTPERIDKHNQFWAELDEIFINQFPEINIIDLDSFKFIGDIQYPFGLSVSHYQTEYYQELMRTVKKISSS